METWHSYDCFVQHEFENIPLLEFLSLRGVLSALQSLPPPAPPEAETLRDVLGDCGEEEDWLSWYRHHADTQPAAGGWHVAWSCKWLFLARTDFILIFSAIPKNARSLGRGWLLCPLNNYVTSDVITERREEAIWRTVDWGQTFELPITKWLLFVSSLKLLFSLLRKLSPCISTFYNLKFPFIIKF